jgi:hypothetical protein
MQLSRTTSSRSLWLLFLHMTGGRTRGVAALLAIVASLLVHTHARGQAEGGAAWHMRRARISLMNGAEQTAARELEAVRRVEPASARGLEAAFLLADLAFSAGRGAEAEKVLAETAAALPEGEAAAHVSLARAWLAIGRGAATQAGPHFARARSAARLPLAREIAALGQAWAALITDPPAVGTGELERLARGGLHPTLRFLSGWTLARTYIAIGEKRRALHTLRAMRRAVRGSSYEDDLELALGLAQLEAGDPIAARRTFQRMRRRFSADAPAGSRDLDARLRLDDLRLRPAELAARVTQLYVQRQRRGADVVRFVGNLLDRPAAADVPAALALTESGVRQREVLS